MLNDDADKDLTAAPGTGGQEIASEEPIAPEESGKGNWREAFRTALDKARLSPGLGFRTFPIV